MFDIRIYSWLIRYGIESTVAWELVHYYPKRALQLLNTIKNEIH